MDILAHALWAGAGVVALRRRLPLAPRALVLTVALAVLPDIPHLLPLVAWSIFGDGSLAAVQAYAVAVPGQEPLVAPGIELWSHHLHCIFHSAVIASLVTAISWICLRTLWIPLLGWWSHILIDVLTHSADYYPSPVLYPFTRLGFDGIAWNRPWFLVLNYVSLLAAYLWLWRSRRTDSRP